MPDWIISTHGYVLPTYAEVASGKNKANSCPSQAYLPVGTKIYFFCMEGEPLPTNFGWSYFNMLVSSNPMGYDIVKKAAKEVVEGPCYTRNYWIHGEDNWVDDRGSGSGIFQVGDRYSARTWFMGSNDGWDLSRIVQNIRPGESLYWLACRTTFPDASA